MFALAKFFQPSIIILGELVLWKKARVFDVLDFPGLGLVGQCGPNCFVWRRPSQGNDASMADRTLPMPMPSAGNTKGGSITVPLTSCLTGLESAV